MRLILRAAGSLEGVVAGVEKPGGCFVSAEAKGPSGVRYGARCGDRGRYRIDRVSEGEYHVEVKGPGRLNGLAQDVTVAGGQALRVDF